MKTFYDERNMLFSRMRLKKGTQEYQEYYKKHPDIQAQDDAMRGMNITDKLRVSDQYKSLFFPITKHNKAILKSLHHLVDKTPLGDPIALPKNFSKNIKAITKHFGADDVGIVKLSKDHFYTHHGKQSEDIGWPLYGKETDKDYQYAIVYIMKMNLEIINRAPHHEELLETENVYLNIGYLGSRLALYIKQLGYKSTFQSEAFYLTPLVPLAYDAGLGEIGMANHIVHPIYGDRIRLGAVLTNLPLEADEPIDFGLEAFCKRCSLCLMNCPSRSIKHLPRTINHRRFYKFNDQTCFQLWKNTGTDCGTCLQSCPFTQGIDQETIQWMKNNPKRIDSVIAKHFEKHTRRRYTKHPLKIVTIEEE